MTELRAGGRTYAGLFLVTAAILMFEILLTRIFSVTLWYHFAFMAISIAMFGMTAGALVVHFRPRVFTVEAARSQMSRYSVLCGLTMLISVLVHLYLPPRGTAALLATFAIVAIPLVLGGITVCLALTRFPAEVGRLYAFDLAGAASGCILLVALLEAIDGLSAVIATAFLATLGGFLFLPEGSRRKAQIGAVLVMLGTATALNAYLAHQQEPLLRFIWAKGRTEGPRMYEKWNSFSRIGVYDDVSSHPEGWGLSPTHDAEREIKQYWLRIDALAGTLLTEFDGDLSKVEHLKYDITNIVHRLRNAGSILIIGAGGGRDVLSALMFEQQEIVAVELNANIIDTVNRVYGDFTGHLDRYPEVTFVNDEARSYVARQTRRFDAIQASWIDTWAATAAGAFVLTENSLYTQEAWQIFLDHLEADGILTFTRGYSRTYPFEAGRLMVLARAALLAIGVEEPENHIMLILNEVQTMIRGNATILLSPMPFSETDVEVVRTLVSDLEFQVGYLPGDDPSGDGEAGGHVGSFARLAFGHELDREGLGWYTRLDPPTDDSPFFFNMLRIKDVIERGLRGEELQGMNVRAVAMLLILSVIVLTSTAATVVVPMIVGRRQLASPEKWPLLVFFAGIGLGFMLIEISQMQRMIVFLGHPTYGLAVVLFTLLLASGTGSLFSEKVVADDYWRRGVAVIAALTSILVVTGFLIPELLSALRDRSTPFRIAVAIGSLAPMGLFMGMMFPLGMRAAQQRSQHLTTWLWSVNGACSVTASVLAVTIALEVGIAASYWTGTVTYVAAGLAFLVLPLCGRQTAKAPKLGP